MAEQAKWQHNRQKLFDGLKEEGFSGFGNTVEEFGEKLNKENNRATIYNTLKSYGYKGIGDSLDDFTAKVMPPTEVQHVSPQVLAEGLAENQRIVSDFNRQSAARGRELSADVKAQNPRNRFTDGSRESMQYNPNSNKLEATYTLPTGERTFSKTDATLKRLEYNGDMGLTATGQLRQAQKRLAEYEDKLDTRAEILMREHERTKESLPGFVNVLSDIGDAVRADKMGGNTGNTPTYDYAEFVTDPEYNALLSSIRDTEKQIRQLENWVEKEKHGERFWHDFGRGVLQEFVLNPDVWDFGRAGFRQGSTLANISNKLNNNEELTESEKNTLNDLYLLQNVQSEFGDLGTGARWGSIAGQSLSFMKDFALSGPISGGVVKGITRGLRQLSSNAVKSMGIKAAEKASAQILKEGLPTYLATNLATRAATKAGVNATSSLGVEVAEKGLFNYLRSGGSTAAKKLIAEQGVMNTASIITLKALGTTAEDLLIRAPLMATTIQGLTTGANIINTKLGPVVFNEETGELQFADDKTWGEAAWQSGMDAVVENMSEMAGAHAPTIVDMARVFGARRLAAGILRTTREGAGTVLSNVNKFLKQAGVNGYLSEVGEEYYGQGWRTLLNLESAYTDVDGERKNLISDSEWHADLWGGIGLTIGLTGAASVSVAYPARGAYNMSVYLKHKHNVRKADKKASKVFSPEQWEPIKEYIDASDNGNVSAIIGQAFKDNNLTAEQKEAITNYTWNLLIFRGYNLGEMLLSRNGLNSANNNATEAQNSYLDGYTADAGERNAISIALDLQRNKLLELTTPEVVAEVEADPIGALSKLGDDPDVNQAVIDFVNAKQTDNGMSQRLIDNLDDAIEESNATVDSCVNRSTGMVEEAILNSNVDNKNNVYVISGNLVANEDYTIDTDKSDNSIIVRDAETGIVSMISPNDILSIFPPVDPNEVKLRTEEALRKLYAQRTANNVSGTVFFTQGDTYTITDAEGNETQIQVFPNADGIIDNGDGTVNVSADGGNTIVAMNKEGIQSMVDLTNRNRVAQQIAETDAKRVEESITQWRDRFGDDLQAGTSFNILYDGKPVTITITEISNNGIIYYTDNNGEDWQEGIASLFKERSDYEDYVNGNLIPSVSYHIGDTIEAWGDNGRRTTGRLVAESPDGGFEVEFDSPVRGSMVAVLPTEEIQAMDLNATSSPIAAEAEGDIETSEPPSPAEPTALSRIPRGDDGELMYEAADADTAWDAIVEEAGDEAMAKRVVDSMVADKEAALKKAEKQKPRAGTTPSEKIAAERERMTAIDNARSVLDHWKRIALVPLNRKADENARLRREAEEAAKARREAEAAERRQREEAARIEREMLGGVPDMVDDKASDARARGYRRVNGHVVERQAEVPRLLGKESRVKFSDRDIPAGNWAIIDASQLQPSHIDGRRNPLHFLDEAQPKERKEADSVAAARRMAGNIRAEEITGGATAYSGSPTVNTRGEVIQGNNRSAALREMWQSHPQEAARYKQYLAEHADGFGFSPEAIENMGQPVLVNMLDVSDSKAIELGQFVASDTETGGIERIRPKNTVQKLGGDMGIFASKLLQGGDEEASFSQLLDTNGQEALRWMNSKGIITDTQYRSAFAPNGSLTGEAKNDLRGIMLQGIFQDSITQLETMFEALPAKAQKAILATMWRDFDSPESDRILPEVQMSIQAYYALSHFEAFANAKNYKEARIAAETWRMQYAFDDATGESYLPSERFSNFALLLASAYKAQTQRLLQGAFNRIFDLVQGRQEETLFEKPDNTPLPLAEAIDETIKEFNLENNFRYDGQIRSDVLGGNSPRSREGRRGSGGNAPAGERSENGEQSPDSAGGTGGNGRRSENNRESGNVQTEIEATESREEKLTEEDALALIANMEENAEVAPEIELTIENWDALFGENGRVNTPIGEVKMGEHQFAKLMRQGRNGKLGMIKPTLENPDIIIEDNSEAGEGNEAERGSSYVYVKTFAKPDGSRFYYFTSVTVSQDGMEVVVSNQEKTKKRISNLLQKNAISWINEKVQSASETQSEKSVSLDDSRTATQADNNTAPLGINSSELLENKDTADSGISQTLGEKVSQAEAETDTNPTDGQKEAGNYKKGHVRVGAFDITIEIPKGSVRSGVDANGKPWQTTMNNTYGYMRGTEGVDGDHIDVFLSDNLDGWDGQNVFVVDQYNEDGTFDEHKVMLGFNDEAEAQDAYFSNYEKGWGEKRKIVLASVAIGEFEKWIGSSRRKTKPFAEYKGVNKEAEAQGYTIEPAQYTTKRGKVLDMRLLKFAEPLTTEQQRAAREIAKSERGWHDREKGGFMMRSEKSARRLADSVLDPSGEKLDDNKPLSLSDIQQDNEPVMRQVDVEGLMQAIYQNGEAKLSDHFVVGRPGLTEKIKSRQTDNHTQKAEQQPQSASNPSGNRLVTDERYKELKRRMKAKLGQLNAGIDPEILAIGTEMAVYHIEKGARKFAEYARDMIADLGDVVRPYLKAFYNGARDLPEVQEAALADEMTPYDEVRAFDVANFDKGGTDLFAAAEMAVSEQELQGQAEKAKEEIIGKRNEKRRKDNEQARANTEAVASETEAVASEAESNIETATDERQINEIASNIDSQIEKVNQQLALLGYYEAERKESDFKEAYGYIRNAEKKAVKDANSLAKRLMDDLGIDPNGMTDDNGKKSRTHARADITSSGGDIFIRIPLADGASLSLSIELAPTHERGSALPLLERGKGGRWEGDNLEVESIMYRISYPNLNGHLQIGNSHFADPAVTYSDLLEGIRQISQKYLPANQPLSFNGYKVGDKVLYTPSQRNGKPVEAVIRDFEDDEEHKPVLDTGLAPVLYEVAAWGDIKPATQNETAEKSHKTQTKSVSSQGKVSDLFGGLSDNESLTKEEENGLLQNDERVRSEGLPLGSDSDRDAGRRRGKGDNEEIREESGRTERGRKERNGRAGSEIPQGDGRSSGRLQGISNPKNTRNNHAERGVENAPASVDARIEANIKAIELARQLVENGETATPEQMAVLRRFSGWGGLGKAFNERANYTLDGRYYYNEPTPENKRIRELLGEEAYQQAVMSANSSYYTPAYVIDTLWDIAERMGFKGGSILEGSAGIGNILGQMPTSISERSNIHAIEIDQTSGNILSLLYPDAKVDIQGFEQTRIPNGSVDLAITNVPFVTGLRVNDTTGDSDLSKKFRNIHDFCIAKNVRKLRQGGIGIFISSNGTLDNSKKLRDWVVNEGDSDFVGAFRLNNDTFGGTSVTSDIIVIRKRANNRASPYAIDASETSGERTAEYDTGETRKVKGEDVPVTRQLAMDYNRYFIDHPENMGGVMRFGFEEGDTYRPTSKGLYPAKGKDQKKLLADFVESFVGMAQENAESENAVSNSQVFATDALPDGKKIGEMHVKDGKLVIASVGGYYPLAVNDNKVKGHSKVECFNAYSAIKEALSGVLEYQAANEGDKGLKPLLGKLNKAYDDFVETYGHFHKNTAISFLRRDVDYPNIFSLEEYKEIEETPGKRVAKFGKTDVFKKRVIEKEKEPSPKNIKDGVIASVFKYGFIDIPYIAKQLGMTTNEANNAIVEEGYGFVDPVTLRMEVKHVYLSGNVREKLRQAEANNDNGIYDDNIKALQEVVPMSIPAHLIDFTLGSSWISPKLYEDYVKDRTGVSVEFTHAGGTWLMKAPMWELNNEKNRSMGVASEILHKTIMGHELIEAAIQNKTITVSQTRKQWDGTTETIVDKDATQACAAKIDEIRQDFKEWARQKMLGDAEMAAEIERTYNDTFNNFVPLEIPSEFVPKYFAGAAHKWEMRPHQGKAIVRGTMQPLMLAHEVGSGKTFTLISIAMEMRRLGTARKPMIVVQNATVGQFVRDAKELYPKAKILTLEDSDRDAEGRKNFYAKIRYNDWDMIVIPQSTFDLIPDSEERQMSYIQDKIEEKMIVLERMKEADEDGSSSIVRQAEREIAQWEDQLAELSEAASKKRAASGLKASDLKKRAVARQNAEVNAMEMLDRRTDDVENFDDMGIDALLVDEAHEYKHLGFETVMKRGVKGVDSSYSKKAQGAFLKTQAVLEKNHGRNVIFATGTPISNTAAEIWTFMRYLMPADMMKEYGIYYFDDFVRNFGNIQQMLEFTTSGKFKENNRFAGYVNLPELVRIWSSVADTVTFEEIEEYRKGMGLPDLRPEMETGKAQDIYLPQTRALRGIMKFVKSRLDEFDKMSGKEKKANSHIPLTMYGIAKAAAVDARLVQEDAEDDPNSKTNEAVRQTMRTLKETDSYKGTVAIFADNYYNKQSGFNLYEDIRDKLIANGVPAGEIVVMKSGMSIKKKLDIFDKVNRGEVRVILGSTATLGTGVNIQVRLHTLIHLDAPNRPMDYTQRNGRIIRQGNLHKTWGKPVRILRFGVEDSLDVTAYQRLKTKGAIADSIMNGKKLMNDSMNNRVLEEDEDMFGDTVAQLSGSEYAMLKNNAEKNVRKFEARKKAWEIDQTYIHNAKPKLKGLISTAEKTSKEQRGYLDAVSKAFPNGKFKEASIGKHKFSSVDGMADFIKEYNKGISDESKKMKEGGVNEQTRQISVAFDDYVFKVKTVLRKELTGKLGGLFTEVRRKMTYSCPELGLEDVPVYQSLLRNAIEDITENVITGKDFEEKAETAERSAKRNRAELEQLLSREGKPFEFSKELEDARNKLKEYSELMKKELQEKEAKYAEMDAEIESANDISLTEEDDLLYREQSDELAEVKDHIEDIFNDAVSGRLTGKPVPIGKLTSEGKAYLENISGLKMKDDIDFVLNPSDLVHIYKKHFGKNEKDKRRNIPLSIDDIRNLSDVVSSPDRIIFFKEGDGSNRNMFYFFKGSEDGTYNLMEIYSDKKGNLTAKTFYKTRKDAAQRVMEINNSLLPTSGTYFGAILSDAKIPKIFDLPNIQRDSFRKGNGALDDDGLSMANDPRASLSGKPTRTARQRREFAERERRRMAERVSALAEKLHLGNVEIVTDLSGLQGKRKEAKGFFSRSTGRITIVVPNHASAFDAEQTLLHEAVGHYGLRRLFGDHFDTFLDNVYQNADEDVRRRIAGLSAKHGWDFRTATEEYLASLAEDTDFENVNASWWQKIKSFFLDMLRKIGFEGFTGVTLSDNELRYLLWRSYENLAEPGRYRGILEEAADIATQMRLKVGNYAIGADAAQRVAENSDLLYRNGEDVSLGLADRYQKRVTSKAGEATEAYQDNMRSVRILQEEIAKETGRPIADFENAYDRENHENSINKIEQEQYIREIMKPTEKVLAKIQLRKWKNGEFITFDEIEKYLIAKHGLERNPKFARRDADAIYTETKEELDKNLKDGKIAKERYNEKLSEAKEKREKNFAKFRERDYSGLTALFSGGNPNMPVEQLEEAAQKYVDDFESAVAYRDKEKEDRVNSIAKGYTNLADELWELIRKSKEFTLNKQYKTGLISAELRDRLMNMFDYYVPLRGFADETAGDLYKYQPTDRASKSKNTKLKQQKAEGRTSQAGNILATMMQMAGLSITAGNRNYTNQALLNLALNHPTNLLTVSGLYYMQEKGTGKWMPVYPEISEDMSAEERQKAVSDFESRCKEVIAKEKALPLKDKTIVRMEKGLLLPIRMDAWQKQQHSVRVQRGGEEYVVFVNGDPRAAEALNGLLDKRALEWAARFTRWVSANVTSRNPEFLVSNAARDFQSAVTTILVDSGYEEGYLNKFLTNYHNNFSPIAFRGARKGHYNGIYALYRKYEKGELDMNNERERYFKEFLENGGETGYTQLWQIDKLDKELKNMTKLQKGGFDEAVAFTKQALTATNNVIEFANRGIENATRFSAYMTSRQMGKSVLSSINDAKDISVNFNRHGSGALGYAYFKSLFMFLNPAIQGLAKEIRLFRGDPAKASLFFIGIPIALGALVPFAMMLLADGGDPEDYFGLTAHTRQNNLVLGFNGNYIKIPLPPELRAFYGVGEAIASHTLNDKQHGNMGLEIANSLSQLFPRDIVDARGLIDSEHSLLTGVIKGFTPDMMKVPLEAYVWNENFAGYPITSQYDWNASYPEYLRSDKNTPKWMIETSKFINESTGGTARRKGWADSKYLNPSAIEHITTSYLGGMFTFGMKMGKTIAMIWDEEMRDSRNVPVVSRLYQHVDAGAALKRYYNEMSILYANECEADKAEFNYYYNQEVKGIFDKAFIVSEEMQQNKFKRWIIAEPHIKRINELRREYNKQRDEGDTTNLEKTETELQQAKKEFVDKMDAFDSTMEIDPFAYNKDVRLYKIDLEYKSMNQKLNELKEDSSTSDIMDRAAQFDALYKTDDYRRYMIAKQYKRVISNVQREIEKSKDADRRTALEKEVSRLQDEMIKEIDKPQN